MDNKQIEELKGSPSRDIFKYHHKKLNKRLYACDIDFVLVEKFPFGVAAVLDFKTKQDRITFAEVVAFNSLLKLAPIFIIKGEPSTGIFVIYQYISGDPKPNPPISNLQQIHNCNSWGEFEQWEQSIRDNYHNTKRVRSNLG